MKINYFENKSDDRFRSILCHDDVMLFQIDCPSGVTDSTHFTMFWRGITKIDDLHEFVNDCLISDDKAFGSLYFFSKEMIKLPPFDLSNYPFQFEEEVIQRYGSPKFIRYEVYTDLDANTIEESRYSVWSSISSFEDQLNIEMTENEVGVYTNLTFLQSECIKTGIENLIQKTLRPSIDTINFDAYIQAIIEILKKQVEYEQKATVHGRELLCRNLDWDRRSLCIDS